MNALIESMDIVERVLDPSSGEVTRGSLELAGFDFSTSVLSGCVACLAVEEQVAAAFDAEDLLPELVDRRQRISVLNSVIAPFVSLCEFQ